MTSPRIVSLLPSATEIVTSLGHRQGLVGRSHECDYPAGVKALPVCTRPRVKLDGTSFEIDWKVKEIVGKVLSVYEVLNDTLKEVSPDSCGPLATSTPGKLQLSNNRIIAESVAAIWVIVFSPLPSGH